MNNPFPLHLPASIAYVMPTLLLTLLFALLPNTVFANSTMVTDAPDSAGIGQPFPVRITGPSDMSDLKITWNNRTVQPEITPGTDGSEAIVLLGTPLTDEPGPHRLEARAIVNGRPMSSVREIMVEHHAYPSETLSVQPAMISPPEKVQERIKRERELMLQALRNFSPRRMWQLPFSLPVKGKKLSRYGLHRTFNGETKRRHKGLDFRAPLGTSVRAVADGKVVLTGDFYFAGNCVFIDHGNGVVTTYVHLSELKVRKGDPVKRGQTIGLSGATGRVTGPHLHMGLCVQGMSVDPEPLFSMDAKVHPKNTASSSPSLNSPGSTP